MAKTAAQSNFDFQIDSLKNRLASAGRVYSANEVRAIVLSILLGRNYRKLTEKATSLEISRFMSWILSVCHSAKVAFGDEWLTKLLAECKAQKGSLEAKWLNVWLMGLTLKTTQNLGIGKDEQEAYLLEVKRDSDALLEQVAGATSLQLFSDGLTPTKLSTGDSVWLLQIAGAGVLTLRGSGKSTVGKLLEKAIARACLTALGLKEGTNFSINLAADQEVDREIDAEIRTKRGTVKIDVGLIGPGNQEVSEDKLTRVGRNGIVLIDKLGAKSKVPANATKNGVHLIVIQNNLPLTGLYNYLNLMMPNGVTLRKPPIEEQQLKKLLDSLPDHVFYLPSRK